ncbi:M24 family metallopeptidase [Oceanispirochaeta crateris]|uniref:M24 family metallopeptidase n=1 Tax=Oceanispirochaeta crateris TaxID=2518645 RepID=A0A5C1QK37_9SPIO|nr:M24 family metallopeptidase [Oceanispirochaeta crateris]QEN07549.1 M24 family metallopeptidase [Oceanispirochaeta crateris]
MLTHAEIQSIADLSLYLHECLLLLGKEIVPGNNGLSLQNKLDEILQSHRTMCHSASFDINVNQRVCHSHPDESVFSSEDIVTLDLVLQKNGLFADSAWTFICGYKSPENRALLQKSWDVSKSAFSSIRLNENSFEMKKVVHRELTGSPYALIEEACGHGIGKSIHTAPDISYSILNKNDVKWNAGMVLTIEPVIAQKGTKLIYSKEKGYTTNNGSPSSYFEHMVAIDENGPRCLNIPQIKDINSIDIFSEII